MGTDDHAPDGDIEPSDGDPSHDGPSGYDWTDRWFNPATLRGIALVAGGLVFLAFPDASTAVLRLVLAGVIIVLGVSDLWAELRAPRPSWRAIAAGIATILVGVALVVWAGAGVRFLIQVGGLLVAIRGGLILIGGVQERGTEGSWLFDIVRGLISIATGIAMVAVPGALVSALFIIVAVTAIVAGAVVISFGVTNPGDQNLGSAELGGIILRWFRQRDTGDDVRAELVDNLYFEDPDSTLKKVGFWTLLVLSVIIATLGVLADSTAVVIGAMLVAPLMTPIMGLSAAIVNGWMHRVAATFATVVGGVAVAVAVAWVVTVWTPQLVPLSTNAQILSRVNPTLIDLLIAIAAGAAGAYATVDRRVSSSITGVAIAVALVPPLGVVGIMLQAGAFEDALGAFLLFATNLVSIILVGALVFLVTGLTSFARLRENHERIRTVALTVVLGAIIIVIPLAFTSGGILASASRQAATQVDVEEWIADEPGLEIGRTTISGSEVDVRISGEGDLPDVADLEAALEDSLGIDVVVRVEYFPSTVVTSDNQ
jgi:uncharacterized hydrophobic protein (TIGR00271 family)